MNDIIAVDNYKGVKDFLKMFSEKRTELVILESPQGLGKTFMIEEAMDGIDYLLLTSHVTPLENYKALYHNKHKSIVYEDIDNLLKSPISVSLFKQVTETKPVKNIQYHSSSPRLDVPTSFETTSNVLISCNKFSAKNENLLALVSRGFWIRFQPTQHEVLKKMRDILPSIDIGLEMAQRKEVLKLIGESASFSQELNLRHLVRGLQLKKFALQEENFNWQNNLEKLLKVDVRLREVAKLVATKKPVQEQIKEFSQSRATFYRLRERLEGDKKNEVHDLRQEVRDVRSVRDKVQPNKTGTKN